MLLRKVVFKNGSRKGFTLVELLVSIGVMTIVLGIVYSGSPQSVMRLALSDNTYQGELFIREAQLQGSAINSVSGTYGGAGVFFNLATSTHILKFKDRVIVNPTRAINIGDGLYTTTPIDEKESVLTTTNRNTISTLCVATSSADKLYCNNANTPPINTLTISFIRPKQEAHIYVNNSTSTEYATACIQFDSFRSPEKGFVKSITVYKSGLITKKFGTCI